MATVSFTQVRIHGAVIVTWTDLSNDDDGEPYQPPVGYRLQSMQFTGTLGSGPSLTTQGSNEATPSTFAQLALATSLGASTPASDMRFYRPLISGGSGSTITAVAYFTLSSLVVQQGGITIAVGQKFTFAEEKASFLSSGSYESLVFAPNKNQFIQCGDVGSARFSVIGADNWTSIQTESNTFFEGSSMGPYTWTDTATSDHSAETEISAANDFANEIFILSNHTSGSDTPGIWKLVPEQADASNGGNPDKWIIEDFVILPDGTLVTGINPDCAVVIQGTLYAVGSPGTGSDYGSTVSRDLVKYNGMATNTWDLTSLVEFGDGSGQISDLGYDGVYLYAMITAGPTAWPQVIEKYKWNSESDIRLVQRYDLAKTSGSGLPSDLTTMKAMDVANSKIYLGDNTNDVDTAATYVLYQPVTTGLADYIRFAIPLTSSLDLNKGLQFYKRSPSLNEDTIDFSSGKATFDGTQRIVFNEFNRGETGIAYGGGNSFTVAATLTPTDASVNQKAIAFKVGSSQIETFGLKADGSGRWQYRYNGTFLDSSSAVAQDGVEQRIMFAYDSVAEELHLYVGSNDTPIKTVSVAPDADQVTGMSIGAANFSGAIDQGWVGEISDVVIYNGALVPSDEPSRTP